MKKRGRRIPLVTIYFKKFKELQYLDLKEMKLPHPITYKSGIEKTRLRATTAYRGNLNPFFDYIKNTEKFLKKSFSVFFLSNRFLL